MIEFSAGLAEMVAIGVLGGAILYFKKGWVPFGLCVAGAVFGFTLFFFGFLASTGQTTIFAPELAGGFCGVFAANFGIPRKGNPESLANLD